MDLKGRSFWVGIALVLSVMVLPAYGVCKTIANNKKSIVVDIDYGRVAVSRTVTASWVKGMTALEILQSVAEVKTKPVGEYVFVVAIDGVEGKRGDMGWYYEVNGNSSDKLAYSKVLNNADHVRWVYKKDVCSGKVDGK
jgi:hypothetical protein